MGGIFEELKRRNVFRVGVAYAVVGWLAVQVVNNFFPALNLPEWTHTFVAILILIGFPFALLFAWAYELTPEGLKKTKKADKIGSGTREASIAVLAFSDLSPDGDQAYFADGISEEILNVLAKVGEFKVSGRTSAFRFRDGTEDLRRIGEQLGVAHLLEGSVRKAGNRVRITAQLIKVEDGFHLWSETYDRELTDIFAIQDEISRAIVDTLKVHLMGEVEAPPVVKVATDIDAYDLYLLGRHHSEKRTEVELKRAQEYFERAIESDPGYAPAYDGLAETLVFLTDAAFGSVPREQITAKALALIEKALEIDPSLPETYVSLGSLRRIEMDFPAAETALKRAIELNPNSVSALNWLYVVYDGANRHREAFEALQRAFELDPLSVIVNANMASELWSRGRTDEAVAVAKRTIEMAPEDPLGYRRYGRILWTEGNLAEAVRLYLKATEVAQGDPKARRSLGYLLLSLGDYRQAETLLGTQRHVVYLAEGRVEAALAAAHECLTVRPTDHATIIATACVELWAGNYDQARLLLEPLAAGSERGKGTLFLFQYVSPSAPLHWDPEIGATNLALARARTGNKRGADELLAQVRSFYKYLRSEGLDHPGITYQEVRVLALEGQVEEALESLREAIDLGWRFWYAGGDPALEALRGEPAFKDMVSEIEGYVAEERAKLEAVGEGGIDT